VNPAFFLQLLKEVVVHLRARFDKDVSPGRRGKGRGRFHPEIVERNKEHKNFFYLLEEIHQLFKGKVIAALYPPEKRVDISHGLSGVILNGLEEHSECLDIFP
jgi:hypothetical protein